MTHGHDYGSALRTFFNFLQWNRPRSTSKLYQLFCRRKKFIENFAQWKGQRVTWKLYQWFFWKSSSTGHMHRFGPKKFSTVITLDLLSGFFLILHSKRNQKVHENYNNDFSEKNVFLGNRTIFGHKMKRPHNSGSALSIFFNLHNQRGREIHQSYFDAFSEKILFQCNWAIFGLKMTYPHNYRSALLIFVNFAEWNEPRGISKLY